MTRFHLVIGYQIWLYFNDYNLNYSTIEGCSMDSITFKQAKPP
jgi:hypothetical protein